MSAWTIVLRGNFWLPHLVRMLDEYRGNSEQRSCADDMIAQIREQIIVGAVGKEETRPLAVIDPEDREQVERLARIYCDREVNPGVVAQPERVAGRLANALREYANPTPPKPEEPTVGALVEDGGVEWARLNTPKTPWHSLDGKGRWATWDDFSDAVRVLSPGIPDA